jgi:hypothetical protein
VVKLSTVTGLVNRIAAMPSQYWRNHQHQTFLSRANGLVADLPRVASPKGIVVFSPAGNYPLSGLYVMLMQRLTSLGWGVTSLDKQIVLPDCGHLELKNYDGRIDLKKLRRRPFSLTQEWTIDLERGICETGGVNYHRIIYLRVARGLQRYRLDYKDPDILQRWNSALQAADALVSVCLNLKVEFADKDIPVRFVGSESHYVPNGVFHFFCQNADNSKNMEFVETNYAYEWYFRAHDWGSFNNFVVENLTRHRLIAAFQIRRERFENWLVKGQDLDKALALGADILTQNRTGQSKLDPKAEAVLDRIKTHKKRGGKVACLFGNLLFDVAVPDDSGPAHSSPILWLEDSIEAVRGTDYLLLIKPHPAEVRRPKHDMPSERYWDLLNENIPDNVIVLDHLWFNIGHIMDIIDLGLVWRGSVTIELAVAKIPTILSGNYHAFEFVFQVPSPKNRNQYREMILNPERARISQEVHERAALYLEYLRSEDNFIKFSFAKFSPFKKMKPYPRWDRRELKRYSVNGDKNIDRICREFLIQ